MTKDLPPTNSGNAPDPAKLLITGGIDFTDGSEIVIQVVAPDHLGRTALAMLAYKDLIRWLDDWRAAVGRK